MQIRKAEVQFLLVHHCDGEILSDIRSGAVYLGVDAPGIRA